MTSSNTTLTGELLLDLFLITGPNQSRSMRDALSYNSSTTPTAVWYIYGVLNNNILRSLATGASYSRSGVATIPLFQIDLSKIDWSFAS
jgi:hypothetical protein